jgi:hypothetical protein
MRPSVLFLFVSTALMAASGSFPATYEGGGLPLSQSKVRAHLEKDAVVFVQHGQQIRVPVREITAISCGSDVRHRMPLVKTETYYIGVTWTSDHRDVQALFSMSGGEYRDFLKALETSTGKKAVDAHKVPVVVHYGSLPTTI